MNYTNLNEDFGTFVMLAINEEVVAVLTDTEYIVDQYVICQAEM